MTDAPASRPVLVPLSEADLDAVQDLFARCADYFLLQDGEPADRADALALFRHVPPGRTPADLVVFGSPGARRLDAVAALLPDHPADGVWYLPFMVIDPDRRGRGLGRAIHAVLERWATERGARAFQLVALEANPDGERFWRSLGFTELRRVGPHDFKRRRHRRIEFERAVATGARPPGEGDAFPPETVRRPAT